MARGDSGRIVIEVDPHLKDELYVELARQRLTLKAWFVAMAEHFLDDSRQPNLFAAEASPKPHSLPGGQPESSEKP
jgi:hypothetical protein